MRFANSAFHADKIFSGNAHWERRPVLSLSNGLSSRLLLQTTFNDALWKEGVLSKNLIHVNLISFVRVDFTIYPIAEVVVKLISDMVMQSLITVLNAGDDQYLIKPENTTEGRSNV